jgi:hypothetical protein
LFRKSNTIVQSLKLFPFQALPLQDELDSLPFWVSGLLLLAQTLGFVAKYLQRNLTTSLRS